MKRIVLFAALLIVGMSFPVPNVSAQTHPLATPSKGHAEKPAANAAVTSPQPPTQPVGKGSGLWEWTAHAPYHDSIVEVSTSHGSGTGVLIKIDESKKIRNGYEGMVLTAWHVLQDDMLDGVIKVTYKNKRRSKGCQILEFDEAKDVAVLWVWVPEDIKPAKLATESIKRGDKLELVGLGGGTKLADCVRSFTGHASPPSSVEKIFADVPLLPGDSGGPVFNSNHEVVGIISGGWFWWDSGLKTASGAYIRTTWPARASNVGPLQSMMAKIEAKALAEIDPIDPIETMANGELEMMQR